MERKDKMEETVFQVSGPLRLETNQLVNMQLDRIEICVWCRTRFCPFPRMEKTYPRYTVIFKEL